MKFSESWLRTWVNPSINTQQLADQITMLGLEVDEINAVSEDFTGVVVAEVVSAEQHPNADKLRVTKINIGQDRLLDIVCGASNCRAGLKVACAIEGAILPGNFKIKSTKLRGEFSEGMLCSYKELGIDIESQGIIELPVDAPIGMDIREYLQLNDKVIEIGLTPNRADCLSIRGIAREVAVVNKMQLTADIKIEAIPAKIDTIVPVNLVAEEACSRYLSRVIKNINLRAETPLWMQQRLERCGMRSLDPIVDVTNYILLELGQPMHAFDATKISDEIIVRLAKNGEKLELLDGKVVDLTEDTLVIADKKGPLAIAGIFGGKASAVNAETKDIVLESAFFAPLAIINRARAYGLHTESSHRFERGVDYNLQHEAMERATALLLAICGGEAGPINEVASTKYLPVTTTVSLNKSKLDTVLGYDIDKNTVTDIFTRLGLQPTIQNDSWLVTIPSWRFDLGIEEDLIEEIARVFGFNNLPSKPLAAELTISAANEQEKDEATIKHVLTDQGYQEVISYSFVDPKLQQLLFPEEESLILPNPISVEMSAMRVSLLPGLLNTVVYNQNRQATTVRIFETGLVFKPTEGHELGLEQQLMLSGVISGDYQTKNWAEPHREVDFFDLKGDVELIFSALGLQQDISFETTNKYSCLHPGQSAIIKFKQQEIGFIGTIHPQLAENLDIALQTIVFELKLEILGYKTIPKIKVISRYPSNRRDIAVIVDNSISANDILKTCQQVGEPLVTKVNLFDVYQGKGIERNCKSLAISLIIQDLDKTLNDTEINAILEKITSTLIDKYKAIIRN